LINAHRGEMEASGFPLRLRGPWAKLEAYLARLALIVSMCRIVADDAPERIEAEDVLRASVLLDYFKNHARRVYVGLYGENRIDSLAEDVAHFLKERGGRWSGQPAELHRVLDSKHKPERAKDLSADLTKAAQRSPVLTFEKNKHEAFTKEDGTRTTRRVWALLLGNSVNSVNSVNSEGGEHE
jgi:putative DNA primase/helicase